MVSKDWLELALMMGSGFVLSLILQWLAIRLAPRLGLMDAPGERKVHAHSVPRAGGICLWISLGLVWLYLLLQWKLVPIPYLEMSGVVPLCGFIFLVLIGLLDDRFSIPWQPRLLGHFLVAGSTLWVMGFFENPLVGIAALFLMVALVNAFNMIDNMDWQCGGVAMLVLLGGLGIFSASTKGFYSQVPAELAVILVGPLAGFLWWNRPVARIFLGDAGSIPLGFLLCWLVFTPMKEAMMVNPWLVVAVPALFLVPLYDLTTVIIIRVYQGKSPFHPDKQHLSHRMVGGGATPFGAVLRILMIQGSGVMAGFMVVVIRHPLVPKVILIWLLLWTMVLAILDYKAFHSRESA